MIWLWNSVVLCFDGNDFIFVWTENENEAIVFQESIDPDNKNLLPNEMRDQVCYYIACKGTVYDFHITQIRYRNIEIDASDFH